MPVFIETAQASQTDRRYGSDVVEIGLLNNLSDAGLEGGERQFIDRLNAAAGSRHVRLRLFSLPGITRGRSARARIDAVYMPFERLFDEPLDGLIVTGCEPRAMRLCDEPFWPELVQVIDWARRHTRSTVWSCLAAHAAVLHLDGIERRRLAEKLSGVFAVEPAAAHPLLADADVKPQVPHSRYNDLAERDLAAAGYDILTRSADVGVDAFVRQGRSLFVFLQGHPEYDADALAREYRRDVLRFLDGTGETYPSIPVGLLDRQTEDALHAFALRARQERDPTLFAACPLGARRTAAPGWNDDFARTLFTNWLNALHAKTAEHAA